MKIKKIETFCDEFVGFVRVTAEDGAQGWGQVSPYAADIVCTILHRQVAPTALGHAEADIEGLVDRPRTGEIVTVRLAGVDHGLKLGIG